MSDPLTGPEKVNPPNGHEDTVQAIADGRANPSSIDATGDKRKEILKAAATWCERKSDEVDRIPGDQWSAAKELAENRAEALREAAGDNGTDDGGPSDKAALSADERRERREAKRASRKRASLRERIEFKESMADDLEAAASSDNANERKAREWREEAAALRDEFAELGGDPESAPASYANELLRAALTGESADETFVRTDDGVARVVDTGDGVDLDTEADDTRAALSVSRFNAAANGVRLTEETSGDGTALRVGNVAGEDTELPAIETRSTQAALGASADHTAPSSNSERIRDLEEKRDHARDMPGDHWDAAAEEAQAKIDRLRGDT